MTYVSNAGAVQYTARVEAAEPLEFVHWDGDVRRFQPTLASLELSFHADGWIRKVKVAVTGPRCRQDGGPYADKSTGCLWWNRREDGSWDSQQTRSGPNDEGDPMPEWLARWVDQNAGPGDIPSTVADIAHARAKRRALL